ncbi:MULTISPECIES: exodeoxyribonuclease V subunit beta [Pseudomonas]|uniref:RecBCD enzyme subunit RecB n=1 Tax=Pseudomonas spirodelae TaxID=3101751 RepID=A0ABU5P536_9PSED|nr:MULTISPECIES: exodeoxyribonuclease V subunit beta [unclassified Pseudomonas]MBU0903103.1 exodeoxyribonuclease V subunit beta [Gammaproteobacteria bacterium]MDD2160193.1 exodeoxyribonuclease V subunit beta [Pseudomonas sp. MIL19]MEA1604779.1 exodeoxyribonuclease V subunit beta [Pseudomonas sp. T5W1]
MSGAALDLLHDSFSGRSLIEASAGTGKTWTLTALYARLLLEKQLSVSQILVVTFTTAATAELRERIRKRLAELLAVYDNGPVDDALLNALHAQYPDAASHRRLLLAVHGFDEAAIFTIHGFCQRALQDAAFEAGGDFDNELTHDDREIIDALLADLWRHELAVAEPEWAAFLVQQKITPQSLRQRLRNHLGKPYLRIEPQPGTHSDMAALRAAWQQAQRLWQGESAAWLEQLKAFDGFKSNMCNPAKLGVWQTELDGYFSDAAALFSKTEAHRRLAREGLNKASKKGCEAPTNPLAAALQELCDALDAAQPEAEQRLIDLQVHLIGQLNEQLPARKAAQRLLAFDDLLNKLQQALQGEGGEHLASTLRTQYPVALIDEFQDTDPVQYRVFHRIYQDAGDLCFVGDPKQAIYAFRGADLATYLQARSEAARQYSLTTNHRSTPQLIASLNQLFDRPMPFAEPGLDYQQVGASDKARAQLVLPPVEGEQDAPLALVWLDDEHLGKGQAGALVATDTARRIAAVLAASSQGEAYFAQGDTRTPIKGGDIAVLVASHRQAGEVAAELAARGVPSVRRGKENVWHSEEAAELGAVLAAYAEPGREGALRYALASRLLGRSAADLAACTEDAQVWDAEREAAERYLQLWQQQGFMRAFRAWLDEQKVAQRLLALVDGERRLTNLLHLAELLQTESLQRPGLEQLLTWFSAQRSAEAHGEDALLRLESDAERVQIVTIHTSKGLEYPLVFCPYLWDGALLRQHEDISCHADDGTPLLDLGSEQLDTHRERARHERFAEKLRLTYVALTRARDRLWLHWGPVDCKPRKDGTLGDSGLHSSALAWLLHGRQLPGDDALAELAGHLQTLSSQGLRAEIEQLVGSSHGHMSLQPLRHAEASAAGEQRAPAPQQLSTLQRSLHSAWRVGSFSGLAAGMHMEAPDRDGLVMPDASEPGSGFFAFPRGARAGTCLHAILEDWARGKASLADLIEPGLSGHGISTDWSAVALEQLQQVVDCDLDGQGLTLSGLNPVRRLPELGFTFPVAGLDMQRLRAILSDPAHGLPTPMRDAAARLEFDSLKGFLKGFIDLTFEHDGRWYIADYKSNWLGPDASYYGGDRLLQALAAEHYYLQYLIYLVALRRFLRQRLDDFHNEQLGGAYYLFLRGMPSAGVYFSRPSDGLLDALDTLFAEGK